MIRGWLLALVLAALAAQEPTSAPEQEAGREAVGEVEGPGPRVRLAGQHSVHAVSDVVYATLPDDPHQLATTLAFPERVRTELSRTGGRASERSVAYRFGPALWTLATDSDESRAVPDADREFLSLEFALRRALLLWPHGHEWSAAEGKTRSATLELADGVATLVATGFEDTASEAADARPTRLAVVDREGEERLRYEALTWTLEGGRWRPHTLRFLIGDEQVWTEGFRLVDRRARFADAWFSPPDRRETPGETVNREIRALDLRPGLVRRRALSGEGDLAEALASARQRLGETVAPAGHRLSRDLRVELDAAGVPRATSAWMEPWSETPPAGWESFPGGPALGRWLPDPRSARAGVIAEMISRAGLAEGETPRLLLQVAERDDGTASTRLMILLQDKVR